jgi:hypothetical protein
MSCGLLSVFVTVSVESLIIQREFEQNSMNEIYFVPENNKKRNVNWLIENEQKNEKMKMRKVERKKKDTIQKDRRQKTVIEKETKKQKEMRKRQTTGDVRSL